MKTTTTTTTTTGRRQPALPGSLKRLVSESQRPNPAAEQDSESEPKLEPDRGHRLRQDPDDVSP